MKSIPLLINIPLVLLLISGALVGTVTGAKILFLLPVASHSQKTVFEPLIKNLALRDHDVTVVSPVASRGFPVSVKEIHPSTVEELGYQLTSRGKGLLETREELKAKSHYLPILWNTSLVDNGCHKLYNDVEIKYLMKGLKRFDLAVVNGLQNECALGLVYHFRVPHIYLVPTAAPNFVSAKFGHYFPTSFVPSPYTAFDDSMTFPERCVNFVLEMFLVLVTKLYLYPHYEEIYRGYVGEDAPAIEDIDSNVGVILMYSNFLMSSPRSLPPNIIEVGGMHCHVPRPLPTELDKFLSEAEDGFIYFSLGHIVQPKDVPDQLLQVFLKVFADLDQSVIWKWDEDIPNLPSNIMLGQWLPQQDLLGHPNIKLFISNGGLLNSQEAICHGVPMLGIPLTGEHDLNMELAESLGFAESWEILDLNETSLEGLIEEMIRKPQYRGRAKHLAKMYRDMPDDPLEKAVFWTEYVIRNKGAPHLRSSSMDLDYFQYHSFDVIACLLTLLFLSVYILCKVISSICFRTKIDRQEDSSSSLDTRNGSYSNSSYTNKHD